MKNAIKSEPVLFQGLAVAVIVAALAALRAFGVPLTDEQANAAKLLAGAVLVLWLFLIRAQVTPAAQVAAKDTGVGIVAGPAAAVATGKLVDVVAPPVVATLEITPSAEPVAVDPAATIADVDEDDDEAEPDTDTDFSADVDQDTAAPTTTGP